MSHTQRAPRLDRWVQATLLSGIVLSGILLSVGLLTIFIRHEARPVGPPSNLAVLAHNALAGNGLAMTELGLLTLMITPLLRVAVLAAGWAYEGERRFAMVAFVVLGLLGFSRFLGVR